MKFKTYVKEVSGAPWEFEEYASAALDVTDNQDLLSLAQAFLDTKKNFLNKLNEIGVEMG